MARRSIIVALGVALVLIAAPLALAAPGDTKKPKACFRQTPSAPNTADTVTFSSDCSSGTIADRAWDFDADGSIDARGATASRAWSAPGDYKVRLVVVDNTGARDERTATVTVANRGPVADFTFTPAEPVAGQTVSLASTSADPDGTLPSQTWDLDNNGVFDNASGPSASFTPTAAGSYPVAIQVLDDRGAAATASKTVVVARAAQSDPPRPPGQQPDDSGHGHSDDSEHGHSDGQSDDSAPAPPVAVAPAPLRWLEPFPVVRIRGQTTQSGVLLTLLTVRAPSGARAELRCAGRGCPERRVQKLIQASSGKPSTVRFKEFEGRLRAGTRLQILVTQTGMVGKYTRFRIRQKGAPVRTDRCLMPDSERPVACPSAPPG
jgi:PKD repeat protein